MKIVNATHYSTTVNIGHYAKLYNLGASRVIFDLTMFQSDPNGFASVQFKFTDTTGPLPYSQVYSHYTNFFAGINTFDFSSSQLVKFDFNVATFQLTTPGCYSLNISTINYYWRKCQSPTIYYLPAENMCYDVCPVKYWLSTAVNYCYPCYRDCLTCTGAASNQCSSCNTTTNRGLNGTSCVCSVRYYDVGSVDCAKCHYVCYTCVGSSSNNCSSCLTADFRVPSGSTCICTTGYVDYGQK